MTGATDYDYDYEYNDDNRQTWNESWNQRNADTQRTGADGTREAQLRGQLDGWNRVNINGERDAHTLVRLRQDNGRSAIVNLGPNVEASRLNLETGDRVAVHGKQGSIDGRQVLMAKKIRAGDRTITMDNWDCVQDDRVAKQLIRSSTDIQAHGRAETLDFVGLSTVTIHPVFMLRSCTSSTL